MFQAVLVPPLRFRPRSKLGDTLSENPQSTHLTSILNSNEAIAKFIVVNLNLQILFKKKSTHTKHLYFLIIITRPIIIIIIIIIITIIMPMHLLLQNLLLLLLRHHRLLLLLLQRTCYRSRYQSGLCCRMLLIATWTPAKILTFSAHKVGRSYKNRIK